MLPTQNPRNTQTPENRKNTHLAKREGFHKSQVTVRPYKTTHIATEGAGPISKPDNGPPRHTRDTTTMAYQGGFMPFETAVSQIKLPMKTAAIAMFLQVRRRVRTGGLSSFMMPTWEVCRAMHLPLQSSLP
jgi:hypothetical protein